MSYSGRNTVRSLLLSRTYIISAALGVIFPQKRKKLGFSGFDNSNEKIIEKDEKNKEINDEVNCTRTYYG